MNDTFIEQVRYEILTDKSNESIHLELSTPTYACSQKTPIGDNSQKWIRYLGKLLVAASFSGCFEMWRQKSKLDPLPPTASCCRVCFLWPRDAQWQPRVQRSQPADPTWFIRFKIKNISFRGILYF